MTATITNLIALLIFGLVLWLISLRFDEWQEGR